MGSLSHGWRGDPPGGLMSACRSQLGSWIAVIGLCTPLAGCTGRSPLVAPPNQRPRVTITSAPAPGSQLGSYSYELSWAGYDDDGLIAHFRYVVDPPRKPEAETTWVQTRLNRRRFTFPADSLASGQTLFGRRFHTVAVEAVDDKGAFSIPADVSFNALTIAPTIRFKTPAPSLLLTAQVAPTTKITWEANDADGPADKLPRSEERRVGKECRL